MLTNSITMSNFFDSRSNDFNTAIDNYRNNINSVAQGQLQTNMSQLSSAKDMMMEKAGILAGSDEASISNKISQGMSKTMDELGLDMSVKTIGEKMLPWASKKLLGASKNLGARQAEARAQARQEGGGNETTIDVNPADDVAREQYLNRMRRNDQRDANRPENSNGSRTEPRNAEDTPPNASSGEPGEYDAVTGNRVRPQEDTTGGEEPTPVVRDDEGNEMEDEDTRVANLRASNEADDAAAGGRDYFTGSRTLRRGDGMDSDAPASTDFSGAAARVPQPAAPEAGAGAEGGEGASLLPDFPGLASTPQSFNAAISEGAARRAAINPEDAEVLRGDFGEASANVLRGQGIVSRPGGGGGARAPDRPDGDLDNVRSGNRFADGSGEAPPPPPRDAPGGPNAGENQTTGRITETQNSPSQIDPVAEQRQIASEREAGQYERPAGSNIEEMEQRTEQTETSQIQRQSTQMDRNVEEEVSEEGGIGLKEVLGGAGDALGFLGGILGPAAAIFGGIEAARGLVHATEDQTNPWGKVQGEINKAQASQSGMNAEISADSFSSMVGAGKPSFGSLAAPTMDTSSMMGAMGSHF